MPATVWKGYISFGLVSIPVRLYSGARAKTVGFHLLHKKDNSRVREVMYCAAEDKPVSRADLIKGFEYKPGRYAVVTPEEIRKVAPRTQTVMEILQFVEGDQIDPIFFESSYYVAPDSNGGKPYALLLEALRESKYDGVAKLTMHGREHVVILRPSPRGIMLHTMFYVDEVRQVPEFEPHGNPVNQKELKLAKTLIDSLVEDFHPEKYKDAYRENLRKLIDAKVKGKEVKVPPAPKEARVVDIMEALRESLARKKPVQAERTRAGKTPSRKRA
ncbi:MAG TPA: Ku protein [Bryobacteraceae bacterium]|jgi:DNA end-binding protein Ku|nr:Ku protein [Bryobacteraceae bacterium]